MSETILCKLCGKRRAKRFCPALHEDICTICCGTEREVTIGCPLDCAHVYNAHQHERKLIVDAADITDLDIDLSEEFMGRNQEFLLIVIQLLFQASVGTPGAVDTDVIDALSALIKTQRTAESGLIYESRPESKVAAAVQRSFSESLAKYQMRRSEREGLSAARSKDVLGVLVFMKRAGQYNLNGRPKGRMFIDVLGSMVPKERIDDRLPSIIL